jgi:ABC-type amino acid transport substrate-binding protein
LEYGIALFTKKLKVERFFAWRRIIVIFLIDMVAVWKPPSSCIYSMYAYLGKVLFKNVFRKKENVMKKAFVVLTTLLVLAIFMTSCSSLGAPTDETWDRIQENGKIVVGVSMDYPPYEYVDANFIADGFDIGLITALSEQMGLPFEVRNYSFNGLYNALQTGQIDVAISAITVTSDRQQVVLFSDVYLTDTASVLAPPGSTIVITDPSQLTAYRVGVQQGTVFDSYMTKNYVETGLMPATQLYRFLKPEDAVADLVANKIDIVLMDTPSAQVYQQQNNLKMAGTGMNPQRYAVAMPLNSPTLQSNINSALNTLYNDGTLGELAEKYLHIDSTSVVPPATSEVPPATPAVPPACIDDMAFVADVTYPDYNMTAPPVMAPGQVFVKTWRVKNTGTCTWVPGYQLAYVYGNTPAAQMGGQPIPITSNVTSGMTVDLSVTLTAPTTSGTYQGFWQMKNTGLQAFGQTIWVGITISDPTQPTPAPVPAPVITTFTVTPGQIQSGQCVTANWVVQGTVDKVVFERNGEDLLPNAPVSGSYTDCPPMSGQVQYGLGAYGPGGKQVMSVYITVSAAATLPPPTATIAPTIAPPTETPYVAQPIATPESPPATP